MKKIKEKPKVVIVDDFATSLLWIPTKEQIEEHERRITEYEKSLNEAVISIDSDFQKKDTK